MRMFQRTGHIFLFASLIASCGNPDASKATGSNITVPAGFTDATLATGLASPTSFALAPDGRIFVTEQTGSLRVIQNGVLLATPFMTLAVASVGERGLLGIAFDPSFTTNGLLYVYYTTTTPTTHNRVSRFTQNGNVVTLTVSGLDPKSYARRTSTLDVAMERADMTSAAAAIRRLLSELATCIPA